MQLRLWAACALALALGCATGGDVTPPAERPAAAKTTPAKPRHTPASAAEGDAEDDDASAPAAAAPKEAPAPPAKMDDDAPKNADVPRRTAADPFGDVGFKEVDQKAWLAELGEKIAQREKVPPAELRVSPGLLRVAYVRSPAPTTVKAGHRAPPRRHEIVVADNQGRRVATFRAVVAAHGDEPPKDLRFLSEDRLVYEVVEPPPAPKSGAHKPPAHAKNKAATRAKPKAASKTVAGPAKPAAPPIPPRTFVIQPIAPRARPIKCVGIHFTFTREHDKLAYVAGKPEAAFLAVDGAQIYPRRGRTIVATPPAWSKDGRSLALLEAPAAKPARLVLVAELDNATGDTTWELPPTANTDGVQVFWAGTEKLVVGKTQMRPVFSAAFTKEMPRR